MQTRAGRPGIPLLGWSKKAWKRAVTNQINDASIVTMYRRVNRKNEEGQPKKPDRADMVGIAPWVDRKATTANLRGKWRGGKEEEEKFKNAVELLDIDFVKDKEMRMRLESIIAGSIRPGSRLFRSKLTATPQCTLCGGDKEDQEHIFWKCPCCQHIRQKYKEEVDKLIAGDEELKKQVEQIAAVRQCGIMNQDIELIRLYDEIADKEKPTPEVPKLSTLREEEREDE